MCYIVNTEGCHLQNLFSDPKTVCRLVWSGTITFMLTTAKESRRLETWDNLTLTTNPNRKHPPTYIYVDITYQRCTLKEQSQKLVTFETFDQSDADT